MAKETKTICLAGGCFWGVQAFLRRIPGVLTTTCGYANGNTESTTYEEVCRGGTGHAEAVLVGYDPDTVSLETLLGWFFRIIDPTARNRQGNDVGRQYRSGIYYADDEQRRAAETVLADVQKGLKKPVATELLPLVSFCRAEEYHQDYLEKHPRGYCHVDFSILDEIDRK